MNNVEGGTISAGVVSAGPSVGGGEFGPSVGIGLTIVNEGPVAPGFLENTMPISLIRFNPVGEIMFNPEPKTPSQTVSVSETDLPSGAEAVDIAEQWLGISKPSTIEVPHPEPQISVAKPLNLLWKQPEVLPFSYPEQLVKPKNEPKIHPNVGQIKLSKSTPQGAGFTELNRRSVQEYPVGQFIKEKVNEKMEFYEKAEVLEKEEIDELRLKDLLDEETAQQRVYEISEAIDLAETEAKKEGVEEIEGWRIIKFLRLHIGLISQIARKIRKDGSLDETLEELAARKFSSKDQAKKQSKDIVAQKEPVKRGKEGKTVREGAVERVFKYHLVSRSPNEEVVTRVVKKHVIQTGNRTEPVQVQFVAFEAKEPRIEDAV